MTWSRCTAWVRDQGDLNSVSDLIDRLEGLFTAASTTTAPPIINPDDDGVETPDTNRNIRFNRDGKINSAETAAAQDHQSVATPDAIAALLVVASFDNVPSLR